MDSVHQLRQFHVLISIQDWEGVPLGIHDVLFQIHSCGIILQQHTELAAPRRRATRA
jgi:hypothetical protein